MTVSDKGGKCNNGVHCSSLSSPQFQFSTLWLHPFCPLKEAASGCCSSMTDEIQHTWRAPMIQQRVLSEWKSVCHQMWKKCVDNEGDWKNNLNSVRCTHDKCIFPYNCIYSFTENLEVSISITLPLIIKTTHNTLKKEKGKVHSTQQVPSYL
jgi:hypothetical protein